jgi:hypothetical protein
MLFIIHKHNMSTVELCGKKAILFFISMCCMVAPTFKIFVLYTRAPICKHFRSPGIDSQSGGIYSSESIPELHIRLQIWLWQTDEGSYIEYFANIVAYMEFVWFNYLKLTKSNHNLGRLGLYMYMLGTCTN